MNIGSKAKDFPLSQSIQEQGWGEEAEGPTDAMAETWRNEGACQLPARS